MRISTNLRIRFGTLVLASGLLAACGGEPQPPSSSRDRPPVAPQTSSEEIVATREPPTSLEPSPTSPTSPPATSDGPGCVFNDPVAVWPRPGWVDVAALGRSFIVAGTAASASGEAEDVFAIRLDGPRAQRLLGQTTITSVNGGHRAANPALVASTERIVLALADGEHRLVIVSGSSEQPGELTARSIGEGASWRFAPALVRLSDGYAVAWTDESATPMRVRTGHLDADVARRGGITDVTPDGGGAAAPTFANTTTLVTIDPRAGISVAHRHAVSRDNFGAPRVARPVSFLADPPELAAFAVGESTWLAYTAVGSVATSAVALINLDTTDPPLALVPGVGYGTVHVDAAPFGIGAVFAVDVPAGPGPDAPRRVAVRIQGAQHVTEFGYLQPEGQSGERSRLAVGANDGVAVSWSSPSGIFLSVGRCTPIL